MTKIWERYFLFTTLKTFISFLVGFYFLYVLIDYASHTNGANYNHIRFQWSELFFYYACEFVERMDVLIPFALLIATVKSLCNFNIHNELIALLASGVSLKSLMRPFMLMALVATALLYANNEWVLPICLKEIRHLDSAYMNKKSSLNTEQISVQYVTLADNSTLLYQSYDPIQESFFDAYWISSTKDIYRIKYLYPFQKVPFGKFVDHIVRNKKGRLVVIESFLEKPLPNLRYNPQALLETISKPEEQPISELWKKLPKHSRPSSEKESKIVSSFYYKLIMPWLCLLAVIGPAPFCINFSRNVPIFFIYAGSIFGLVGCYLIMGAALVLGERQVISPLIAISAPFLTFVIVLGWRFIKKT